MKIQSNTTKINGTIIAMLVIAIIISSPTMLLPQLSWATSNPNPSWRVPDYIQKAQAPPADPALSDIDKKDIANAVLNVPGVKAWSNQWQVAGMGYLGTKSGDSVTWNDAIVVLRLPNSVPTPVLCNVGWTAWAKVDLSTKQVLEATYPTLSSNQCDANELGTSHLNEKKSSNDPPGFSIGTQNDVNGTHWYGNYAVIETPSYRSTIFQDIYPTLIAQIDNALWNTPSQCGGTCFTQAGWEITDIACSSCGISANSTDIVYVDQSSTGTNQGYNTGISWSSGTTEVTQISCPSGSSDYKIHISYGASQFNWTTKVPCGTAQLNDVFNNSVFFETHYTGSSSNWSGDVTGSILGTSAEEYDNTNTAYYWSTSHDVDVPCTGTNNAYASTVMTGSLASNQNAYWTYLSNVAHAC